jgi:hypothetical protein
MMGNNAVQCLNDLRMLTDVMGDETWGNYLILKENSKQAFESLLTTFLSTIS